MVHADRTAIRTEAILKSADMLCSLARFLAQQQYARCIEEYCSCACRVQHRTDRILFCCSVQHAVTIAQLQHPDLLAVTGFPCPGRMVLGLLFTTGWLAILNYWNINEFMVSQAERLGQAPLHRGNKWTTRFKVYQMSQRLQSQAPYIFVQTTHALLLMMQCLQRSALQPS